MDIIAYHQSIRKEIDALKDRIENLMHDPHWLTVGEWKESILRTVLRRYLPENIRVGRGFVFTPQRCSSQIDILVYDSSFPVLFKDGDLVFVTPDSVKALIEVKSRATNANVSEAVEKLVRNLDIVYQGSRAVSGMPSQPNCFSGVFAYESDIGNYQSVLESLRDNAEESLFRVVSHMSLGPSSFIRFWESDPEGLNERLKWHCYQLENLSPAYFISNLISSLSPGSVWINQETWFPLSSKELLKTDQIFLNRPRT
jgi:hypothetical protein